MSDINANGDSDVEIQIRHDGRVLWIHVDGKTVLRCCRIRHLEIMDQRPVVTDIVEGSKVSIVIASTILDGNSLPNA